MVWNLRLTIIARAVPTRVCDRTNNSRQSEESYFCTALFYIPSFLLPINYIYIADKVSNLN